MFFSNGVGFEISGNDLRIAVVRVALGRFRYITDHAITGFTAMTDEEKLRAVTELVRKHKISSGRVFLSLARESGIVRQVDLPVEVSDKLRSVISLQVEAQSPWPADEIYWDYSADTPRKGAKTITVNVVMIPRAALDPWIGFFKSAGFPLSGASLSSLVCAHGITALWPDSTSTIALGCEPGYVEGTLVHASRFASITVSGAETESAARSAVERLMSIGRVQSPDSARLIVHGPASSSLKEVSAIALPLVNSKVETSRSFGAVSAALAGLKRTAFSANLVPPDQRFRRNQLQLIPTYGLVLLTVLLGIVMAVREPYQSMVYASKLDEEIQKVAPQVKEVSVQEAEMNRLSEKYRVLVGEFLGRDFNLDAMRELSRVLPPTAWLTNYTYQNEAITISGFAQSAADVQKQLEDSALFKDVQFTNSVSRDATGKDRFSMKAAIEVPK